MSREKGVDARLLLPELQGLLSSGSRKVYEHMADVDSRLRGKGFPNSVAFRSVEPEIQYMDKFLGERTLAEIQLWKPKHWYEAWHEQNTFWIWLIGIVVGIASVLAKLASLS